MIKGTLVSYCRGCQQTYCREHYAQNKPKHNQRRVANQDQYRTENRVRLLLYLASHHCVDCGESDPIVLELDHVRGKKEFNIGDAIWRRTWRPIEREIQKCEVRCANCHRRRTAREHQWFKSHFFGT